MYRFIRPLAALAIATLPMFAADAAPTEVKAKAYPLTTCIVSDEKLEGDMGGPVTVVKDGQEWKFCCKSCVKTFNKDPAKFQTKLDEAVKKQTAEPKAEPKAEQKDMKGM